MIWIHALVPTVKEHQVAAAHEAGVKLVPPLRPASPLKADHSELGKSRGNAEVVQH